MVSAGCQKKRDSTPEPQRIQDFVERLLSTQLVLVVLGCSGCWHRKPAEVGWYCLSIVVGVDMGKCFGVGQERVNLDRIILSTWVVVVHIRLIVE